MKKLSVGVLGLQGAIEEHEESLHHAAANLDIEIDIVRLVLPDDLDVIDGIVMPGGESTAMKLIGSKNGMLDAVRSKITSHTPVFGTCAGAILLSKNVKRTTKSETTEGAFPFLDATILRNGYGRQADSFSVNLNTSINSGEFRGIFIRAPIFQNLGPNVEILASVNGNPVLIKENSILASTFHPELTTDSSIHQYFLEMVSESKSLRN